MSELGKKIESFETLNQKLDELLINFDELVHNERNISKEEYDSAFLALIDKLERVTRNPLFENRL